jgi:hypothetical protein
MNTIITPEVKEVMNALHYRPSVSVIMPFEPKISLKTELAHSLKTAADRAERELLAIYPTEMCDTVMKKLRAVIKNLNFNLDKKSIAIYVSPVFEKVIYLDSFVNEKIMVDDSFEIRDLIYNKKQVDKYLVLLLSGKESRILLMNFTKFSRVRPDTPESIFAYTNDSPERTGNFTDMVEHKQVLLEKFLSHIDNSLDEVFKKYPLPLFVVGTDKIIGHFKHLTKHAGAIANYIHGNYEEAGFTQLKELLKPHLETLNEQRKNDLLHKLDIEAGNKKLVTGVKNIWAEAVNHKGRLLVVEKNYVFAAQHGSTDGIIEEITEPFDKLSYIRDAVDDIIEKVLENGGDVEFVDDNDLKKYDHIALIKYY